MRLFALLFVTIVTLGTAPLATAVALLPTIQTVGLEGASPAATPAIQARGRPGSGHQPGGNQSAGPLLRLLASLGLIALILAP